VRNEAATMLLKSKSQPNINTLDQPKMKKIRYLLDPAEYVISGNNKPTLILKYNQIPMTNLNSQMPRIKDIPRNNYDEWGNEKIKEQTRANFRKTSDFSVKIEHLQVNLLLL
jgi:hypothetical protein